MARKKRIDKKPKKAPRPKDQTPLYLHLERFARFSSKCESGNQSASEQIDSWIEDDLTSGKPIRPRPRQKTEGRGRKNLYLHKERHRRFQKKCANAKTSASAEIDAWIREALGERSKK